MTPDVGQEEFEQILASRAFAHAGRLRDLLKSLAEGEEPEAGLAGTTEIRRLQQRLAVFYSDEGKTHTTRLLIEGGRLFGQAVTPAAPGVLSIAILPVLHAAGAWSFLAEGFTEELIYALSGVAGLRAIGRASVFQYRGYPRDLKTIAKVLSADLVLEASLEVNEPNFRMVLELSDRRGGWLLWQETYARPLSELLEVRAEILASIADALRLPPLPPHLLSGGTEDPEAFMEFLRARTKIAQRTPDALRESLARFRASGSIDARYGRPQAGLAEACIVHAVSDLASANEVMPQAKSAARKSMELDPESAEPLFLLGAVHSIYDWQWERGESEIRDGLARKPESTMGHFALGFLNLTPRGRWDEALGEMTALLRLDPVSMAVQRDFGVLHFLRRDYDAALALLRRARDQPGTDYWLGRLYLELRRYQDALDTLGAPAAIPNRALSAIAYTYARMGRRGQAEQYVKQLRELSRNTRVSPLDFALPLLGLGRVDEAFAYLRQALAERSMGLYLFRVDPVYDAVRQDPRCAAILSTMNLQDP